MLYIVLAQPPAHLTFRSYTINDITGPDMVSATRIMLSKALRREGASPGYKTYVWAIKGQSHTLFRISLMIAFMHVRYGTPCSAMN